MEIVDLGIVVFQRRRGGAWFAEARLCVWDGAFQVTRFGWDRSLSSADAARRYGWEQVTMRLL